MSVCLLYMTFPNKESAKEISRALLEHGLVACVNILPASDSLYIWKGKFTQQKEYVVLAKTMSSRFDRVRKLVSTHHPYEVPCILKLKIEKGNRPYLNWVKEQSKTLRGRLS